MSREEKLLVALLRFAGVLTLTAIFFVFVPMKWMQDIAGWLTLEEPAATPLSHYLTRSLSAMYAVHGALLLYLSLDAVRFAPAARFLAGAGVVMGALLLGIDYFAGMPWFWTLGEGPFVVLYGGVLYVVADRVCRR